MINSEPKVLHKNNIKRKLLGANSDVYHISNRTRNNVFLNKIIIKLIETLKK